METTQFYILAGLSGLSIAACAVLFYKLRAVIYLLEQPVVKKMSPQLKLKPVKVDDSETVNARPDSRPANTTNGNRGPRPNFERPEGGERQNRDSQPRHDRGPRPDRPEGGDRGPRPEGGDRGPRNDRFSGRDRGPRHERNDRSGGTAPRDNAGSREPGERTGGFDRNRNRNEGQTHTNEPATTGESVASPASRPAAISNPESHGGPALAPRRPLPSTVDSVASNKEFTPPEPVSAAEAADALFMRDDSDIQHGRRNQLKKKPKFDVSEEDVKLAASEESKV